VHKLVLYGDECQYKTPYEPVTEYVEGTSQAISYGGIPNGLYAAVHSCLSEAPIDGLCYKSPHGPMPEWNVSLVTNMKYLFSVDSSNCVKGGEPTRGDGSCWSWAQHNPDISKWDTSSVVNMKGMFRGGNTYFTDFNQDISGWDTSSVTDMAEMFYGASKFNHYVGDWDDSKVGNYFYTFWYATAFQAKYTCASSSSQYVKPSSCKTVRSTWIAPPPPPSPPLPPPPPLSPPTDSVTINGKQLYQDSDGWILLLAYEHKAGENNALSPGTVPTSPTSSYSHVWLEDLSLTSSDVDSVRFYCTSSSHSRVMHFSVNNAWIKSAIVTGSASGNSISFWTGGTTKFSDHTANIPDQANAIFSENDLLKFPFYYNDSPNSLLYGIRAYGSRFACDDYPTFNGDKTGYQYDNLFQIWFKRKS